ncbi:MULTISPECIES: restriction endonuclease subunit S [unclassified Clostridium]|uniref:restriction endonuclease subunit S n=1 Tax=unclassified Clostridium TaxID=2614128 RepID=UPI002A81C171|nr:restriction endonuclease subunit S [Clostridium sp.]MDY4252737.1 restriction endonuclease subunit S [Clostridium sp.]
MKSNYKMLGDYIREVNVRNTELKDLDLLGISIQKEFIPSIANTIGTDMSKYKIVKKNQFAYGTVTSRNGDKISIALLQNCDEALISQAYISFEVIDENILLPEYLMMWFRREEFDRYARYMSYGSAREVFSWEEMCNVKLPIPSIEKQREIVEEYNTILNKIELNENKIAKLESLAQTIYNQWFVDFKYPDSDRKLVFNEILECDIPLGWNVEKIANIISVKDGTHDSPKEVKDGFPLVTSTHLNLYNLELDKTYNISEDDFNKINKRSKVEKNDILFSMIGTVGLISYILYDEVNFAIKNVGLFKTSERRDIAEYILFYLKSNYIKDYLKASLSGSTQSYVTLGLLRELPIIIPADNVLMKFKEVIESIIQNINCNVNENLLLDKLKKLLLEKLSSL